MNNDKKLKNIVNHFDDSGCFLKNMKKFIRLLNRKLSTQSTENWGNFLFLGTIQFWQSKFQISTWKMTMKADYYKYRLISFYFILLNVERRYLWQLKKKIQEVSSKYPFLKLPSIGILYLPIYSVKISWNY